jgi:hypothetical protein
MSDSVGLYRAERCGVCGRPTERLSHCGAPTTLASGFRVVDNDVVNVLSCLAGALVAFGLCRCVVA